MKTKLFLLLICCAFSGVAFAQTTPSHTPTSTATPTVTNTPIPTFTPTLTLTPTPAPTFNAAAGTSWAQLPQPTVNFQVNNGIRAYQSSVTFTTGTGLKVWTIGGENNSGHGGAEVSFNDVWSSADGENWTQATAGAAFSKRYGQTSVVFDNGTGPKMWVIGGQDATGPLNDVWSSSDGVTWNQVSSNAGFPARYEHTSVVYGGKIWVIGGIGTSRSGTASLNDVWCSSDGAHWTEVTSSADFSPRSGHSSVVYDNGTGLKMWVIGGGLLASPGSTSEYNDVWYSTNGMNWIETKSNGVSTLLNPLPGFSQREFQNSIVYNGRMWVIGGQGTTSGPHPTATVLNDVWYSYDGINWTQATSSAFSTARFGQSGVIYGGQMFQMGGETHASAYSFLSDVWVSPTTPPPGGESAQGIRNLFSDFAIQVSGDGTITPTPTTTPTIENRPVFSPTPTPTPALDQEVLAAPNFSSNGQPIKFQVSLKDSAKIHLSLYTISGELVYQDQIQGAAGSNSIVWDLVNRAQEKVASGMYVYEIQVSNGQILKSQSGKVLLLR